ncbi:MAG: hypothetical protein NC299_18355 [Lachnospiraceae bacterium]|nr:hypothetical protein [Ruminococcus sp.]MCM1277291.1 hypothetical protein [Lachnospiraceae bacterium]
MEIKINDFEWQVDFINDGDERLTHKDSECFGITIPADLRIFLSDNMPKSLRRRIVIHELVHAFLYSYNVSLPSDADAAEEAFCDFIGAYLSKIYKAANKIMSFYEKGVK